MSRQTRSIESKFVTREADDKIYIEGYFAVFNKPYVIMETAHEYIMPSAFDEQTLADDVRALINHDTTLVLGRNKAGTLALRVDDTGLYGVIEVNKQDVDAMNLYARIQRGDVNQCSFGFDILGETHEQIGDISTCKINKIKLYEVSAVTFPAYEDTSIKARAKTYADKKRAEWRMAMKAKLKGAK